MEKNEESLAVLNALGVLDPGIVRNIYNKSEFDFHNPSYMTWILCFKMKLILPNATQDDAK